jgi:SAM-dependent methyltransferase
MGRPFKDALCKKCESVYAVDLDPRINDLNRWENLIYITADFTKRIDKIATGSLDRVFCISVLEDLGGNLDKALAEFKRVLKPDGKIVITMDMQYNPTKPLGKYPAGSFNELASACAKVGLQFVGDVDLDKTDAVFHSDYNLCVFHCVLKKVHDE